MDHHLPLNPNKTQKTVQNNRDLGGRLSQDSHTRNIDQIQCPAVRYTRYTTPDKTRLL